MNPYDFALQMEKNGETFYRRLADESPSPGVAAIFTLLAHAEMEHQAIVLRMKNEQPAEVEDSQILDKAKSIFLLLEDTAKTFFLDPNRTDPYVHQYRQAQEIERLSAAFYREQAAAASSPAVAGLFGKLMAEEDRHYWILHNLIEHVGRPDSGWIEFAEWHHLEHY